MTTTTAPTISFEDEGTCYSVFLSIAEREFYCDISLAEGVTGKPSERVCVVGADDDGVWVIELDEDGAEIRNVRTHIAWDEFTNLHIR